MHLLRRNVCSFLMVAGVLAVLGIGAQATTVQVGNCLTGYPNYSSITLAVMNTPVGGIIEVCPGSYPEQVTIAKKLTIEGVSSGGQDAAVITPPSGGLVQNGSDIFGNPVAAQFFVTSPGGLVTLKNLTVDGTGNNVTSCGLTPEGIYYQNAAGSIIDNVVRNQYQTDFADYGGCQNGLAINIESPSAYAVTVSDNSVRAYQKNGITATGAATGPGSLGPVVTITGNYIVGLGATAMNWQGVYLGQGTAGENGIQVGFGASGKVTTNTVDDNIWGQDTSSDPGDAASGILVYASVGFMVESNDVGSAQFGIVADTDPTYGPADNTTISMNRVAGTQIFDGIDVCSNHNTVSSNTIYGSAESAVHLDDSCGSGNNNSVTANKINEACAGILLGTGTGNTNATNTYFNVVNTTFGGDTCTAPGKPSGKRQARPSPYKPNKK